MQSKVKETQLRIQTDIDQDFNPVHSHCFLIRLAHHGNFDKEAEFSTVTLSLVKPRGNALLIRAD